ncbi:MAG: aminopeptidase N [Candidatus Krumholzibacteriia bacterium]
MKSVIQLMEDEDGPYQRLIVSRMGLSNGGYLELTYQGVFLESVEDAEFSRENVGGEISATISEEGVYLSANAGWLVSAPGLLATHELTIDTPPGFEAVTQGERTSHQTTESGLRTTWLATHPSDGLNLVANRFVVHEEEIRDGLVSMTFFMDDDPRLRAIYMERTRVYLDMYEKMLGPYPYTKFATVENWFPTGYGMPSYTLLGGQVLRLPFIPYTSFGHEIAHNWWGNSVFVDFSEGNWCEGLTVYCADYHYKAMESETAAREYRRNALKDYAAYVSDPSQDFPLNEFKSRHSGATRAVGYGKSMMVFHMASRLIGEVNFFNALSSVAEEFQFKEAAWSDFMVAFSAAGDRDLTGFQAQWLSRVGAPKLGLEEVEFAPDRVKFTLSQAMPAYVLEVPVVVSTAEGDTEHVIVLASESQQFSIAGSNISKVAVDPDYHLFRMLPTADIEPTISQVLASEAPVFLTGANDPMLQAASREFATNYAEDENVELRANGEIMSNSQTHIIINPDPELLKKLSPPELMVSGRTAFISGKRYGLDKFDLVFTAYGPDNAGVAHLVILCDSAPRLASLASRVTHYGKYSWLMMPAGNGRPDRGNWATQDSPLTQQK